MRLRKLELQEHQASQSLYEEVFNEDSARFVEYYYTEKTKDNQIYVIEEDGKIRSMLHLNPYSLWVNGSRKDANYIVAVATQKEYRKRGYMASLLKKSLEDMYQAGEAFTFLMPASESIYLPFDFRTVYEQKKRYYRQEEPSEEICIKEATDADCKELAEFANKYLAEHFQVFAIRDEAYYQRLLKEYKSDGGGIIIFRKDGGIVNCKICIPGGEKVAEEEEVLEGPPKIMIRIVDVRRILMSLSLRSLMGVSFQVTDPIIEENNRCLLLTGTEFSGVMLMEGKPENSEGTITIAALASLIFGAKTVDEACQEKDVQMSERMKEELKKIIPLSKIYLNEVV